MAAVGVRMLLLLLLFVFSLPSFSLKDFGLNAVDRLGDRKQQTVHAIHKESSTAHETLRDSLHHESRGRKRHKRHMNRQVQPQDGLPALGVSKAPLESGISELSSSAGADVPIPYSEQSVSSFLENGHVTKPHHESVPNKALSQHQEWSPSSLSSSSSFSSSSSSSSSSSTSPPSSSTLVVATQPKSLASFPALLEVQHGESTYDMRTAQHQKNALESRSLSASADSMGTSTASGASASGGSASGASTPTPAPLGPCKTCTWVIEEIKKGTNMLMPQVCANLFLQNYAADYSDCHQVLSALSYNGNNVRFWLFDGCTKYEVYKATEIVKPCPSHVICSALQNLQQTPFCSPPVMDDPFTPPTSSSASASGSATPASSGST